MYYVFLRVGNIILSEESERIWEHASLFVLENCASTDRKSER
jgi:hypothetical protein